MDNSPRDYQWDALTVSDTDIEAGIKIATEGIQNGELCDVDKRDLYEIRGTLYEIQQDYAAAIQDISTAISLDLKDSEDNDLSDNYAHRARLYRLSENYQAALEDLTSAIGLELNNYTHYVNRAEIQMILGDLASAIPDFQKALTLVDKNDFDVVLIQDGLSRCRASKA